MVIYLFLNTYLVLFINIIKACILIMRNLELLGLAINKINSIRVFECANSYGPGRSNDHPYSNV